MRAILMLCAMMAATPAWAAEPAFVLRGKGVQVYVCAEAAGAFAWRLTGPDAMLTDPAGQVVGHHFAGPSWQGKDGSLVVGEAVASSTAPTPGAVAWLVLRAKAHAGAGLFASVAAITRTATEGGVAPATGCDAAHVGNGARVDYQAIYTFFPG